MHRSESSDQDEPGYRELTRYGTDGGTDKDLPRGKIIDVTNDLEFHELLTSHFHAVHIQKHSNTAFEELVAESGHLWQTLPDSVIGTLIYFLLVEHNDDGFDFLEVLKCMSCVGFPVYFTFFLQGCILYELYLFLDYTNAHLSYCKSNITLLLAIVSVFYIFMVPSVKNVMTEMYIVLKGERVAFTSDNSDVITIHKLFPPTSKRIFMYLTIVLPESCILLFCCYTGIAYV